MNRTRLPRSTVSRKPSVVRDGSKERVTLSPASSFGKSGLSQRASSRSRFPTVNRERRVCGE
ncbi:MAG: hypothetical protein MR590_07685 [Clostridiales bacterium]|nr:hypothetical protein [Clostridiales bacterium]MDD6064385.1 hypothetical protein [Clostridiales bacterium]